MKTKNLILTTTLLLALPLAAVAQTADETAANEAPAKQEMSKQEMPKQEMPKDDTAKKDTKATQSEHVARATFTTDVVEHEPVDELEAVPADAENIAFFTEIVDLKGEQITHTWMHDGEVVAEVPIEIGGPRWRVHSIKTLPEPTTGTWTVEVRDSTDTVLYESSIEVAATDDPTTHSSTGR